LISFFVFRTEKKLENTTTGNFVDRKQRSVINPAGLNQPASTTKKIIMYGFINELLSNPVNKKGYHVKSRWANGLVDLIKFF
jgi:hypothetical protein